MCWRECYELESWYLGGGPHGESPKLSYSISGTSRSQKWETFWRIDFYSSLSSLLRSSVIKTDFSFSLESFDMPPKLKSWGEVWGGKLGFFRASSKEKKVIWSNGCQRSLPSSPNLKPKTVFWDAAGQTLAASLQEGETEESWSEPKTQSELESGLFVEVLDK